VPEAKSYNTTIPLFLKSPFLFLYQDKQKTQSFPSSQSSITNREKSKKSKNNAEKHFRLLIRLGDWLHTVIDYNTAVRFENPWWLRERYVSGCLSLSSLNAKTDTLKIKQNCAGFELYSITSWGTWLKHSTFLQSARSCENLDPQNNTFARICVIISRFFLLCVELFIRIIITVKNPFWQFCSHCDYCS